MRAKVLRPIPGTREYQKGEEYEFTGDTQWLVKGRYIQPLPDKPEKATANPEKR